MSEKLFQNQNQNGMSRRSLLNSVLLTGIAPSKTILRELLKMNELNPIEPVSMDMLEEKAKERFRKSTGILRRIVKEQEAPKDATAVHIGNGRVLSAKHLVTTEDENENPLTVLGYQFGHPSYKFNNVGFTWTDDSFDIAEVSMGDEHAQDFEHVPLATDLPKPGEPVFSFTYQKDTLNDRAFFAIHPVAYRFVAHRWGTLYYVTGKDIYPEASVPRSFDGASGAGIVNVSGELIGINFGSVLRGIDQKRAATIDKYVPMFGYQSETVEELGAAVPVYRYVQRNQTVA